MIELIQEERERIKNNIINYLNHEIERDKKCRKYSVESCDKNYYNGCVDTLESIKYNLEKVIFI